MSKVVEFTKYYLSNVFLSEDTSDGFPDSSDVDSDGSWKQMLQLRGTSR